MPIGGGDMPTKRNSQKLPPAGRILLLVPTATPSVLSEHSFASFCKIPAKLDNPRQVLAILAYRFTNFGVPFAPTVLRVGEHNPTRLVP